MAGRRRRGAGGDLSGVFGDAWRQSNCHLAVSASGDARLASERLVRVPVTGEPESLVWVRAPQGARLTVGVPTGG